MVMQVLSGLVPLDALRRLLTSVWPELASYAIVEKVDDLRLFGAQKDTAPDPADWPQGRAFGEQVEVHWEQRGEGYHVVLADESGGVPAEGLTPAQDDWSGGAVQTHRYFLWHKGEARVGRFLNTDRLGFAGRTMLTVKEYHDACGALRFYRYVGIHAATGKEGEDEPV